MAPKGQERTAIAAQFLSSGCATTAKEALQMTRLFTSEEINSSSIHRNIRKIAQRKYDKIHGIGEWTKRKKPCRTFNNHQPSFQVKKNPLPKTAKLGDGKEIQFIHQNGKEIQYFIQRTNNQKQLIENSSSQPSPNNKRKNSALLNNNSASSSSSKNRKIVLPKDKGFRLSPQQVLKLQTENAEREEKYKEAVRKAVILYKDEKGKCNGMSSLDVSKYIENLTSFHVPSSTIRDLVSKNRLEPMKRGPKKKNPEVKNSTATITKQTPHRLPKSPKNPPPPILDILPPPEVSDLEETVQQKDVEYHQKMVKHHQRKLCEALILSATEEDVTWLEEMKEIINQKLEIRNGSIRI